MKAKSYLFCVCLSVVFAAEIFAYDNCREDITEDYILSTVDLQIGAAAVDVIDLLASNNFFVGYKKFYISKEVRVVNPKIFYKAEFVTVKKLQSDIVALLLAKGVVVTFLPEGVVSVTYNDSLPWLNAAKEE